MMIKNISDTDLQHLGTIAGYDVFVPNSYYNPLSFNKRGCPIWIKVNSEGECHVIIQKTDNNLEEESTNYIMDNLPKKPSLHCCSFSPSLQKQAGIVVFNKYGLNCACIDEKDKLHAYITVGDGHVADNVVMMIRDLWYDDKEALLLLRDYLLREENINKHRSEELWHTKTENEVIEILHFIDRGNGLYSWQFE